MSELLLSSSADVIRSLITYTDWCQPGSSSVMQVGAARRSSGVGDGLPGGLLDTVDERAELCRRMRHVGEPDRQLLFLWYVRQFTIEEIARELGISRRQCFRRRSNVIRQIVDLAEPVRAA